MKAGMVFCVGFVSAIIAAFAGAQTLTWSPAVGSAVWDTTSLNWSDGTTPTAWVEGADALFPAAASLSMVEVVEEVSVGSVTFGTGANGVTLAGPGRLREISWVIATDEGTTNSVATEILALSGVSVSGSGAVALGRVSGRVRVASGTLLATASDFATADIKVEGGVLATLGAPAFSESLLLNGSFEEPALAANSFKYVNAGGNGVIDSWSTTQPDYIARSYPTEPGSTWISGGSVPDGNHVLILQRHGTVVQSFNVASAGFYQVAFDYFRRRAFIPHAVTTLIDGIRLPTLLTLNDQFDTAQYVSVPLYLSAGNHTIELLGCGTWYDSSTMIDLVTVAPLSSSQPCRALAKDSFVYLASGTTAALSHSGNLELAGLETESISVVGSGTWSASAPVYKYDTSWLPSTPVDNPLALLEFYSDAVVPSSLARHLMISGPATLGGDGLTMSNLVATFDATPRITTRAPATINTPLAFPGVTAGVPTYGGTDVIPVDLIIDAAAPLTISSLNNHNYAAMYKTGAAPLTLLQPLVSTPNSSRGGGFLIYDGDVSLPSFVTNPDLTNDIFIYALPARSASLTVTGASEFGGGNLSLGGDGNPVLNILDNLESSGRTLLQAKVNTLYVAAGKTYSTVYMARDNNTSDSVGKGLLLKTGGGTLDVLRASNSSSFSGYAGQTVIREGAIRIREDADPSYNGGRGGTLGQTPSTLPILLGDALTPPTATTKLILAGNAKLIAHDITVNADSEIIMESTDSLSIPGTITLNRELVFRSGPEPWSSLALGTLNSGSELGYVVMFHDIRKITIDDAPGAIVEISDSTLSLSPGVAAATTFHNLGGVGATFNFEFGSGGSHDTVSGNSIYLNGVTVNLFYANTETPFAEPGTYTLFSSPNLICDNPIFAVGNPQSNFDYDFNLTESALTLTISPKAGSTAIVWQNSGSGNFSTPANWTGNLIPISTLDAILGSAITGDATVTLTEASAINKLSFIQPLKSYTLAGSHLEPLVIGDLDVRHGSHTVSAKLISAGATPLPITVASGAGLTFANATLDGGLETDAALTLSGTSALTITGSGFDANYAGELSGSGTLTLNAAGATQKLTSGNKIGTTPLAVTDGRLEINGLLSSTVASASGSGTLAVGSPAVNGLTAYWYNGAHSNAVVSRAALESVAVGTPAKIEILSGENGTFYFSSLLNKALQSNYWLVIMRGSITLPVSDNYVFHIVGDDNVYLAIDGKTIATKTPVGASSASAGYLTAGTHDILIGLYQATSAAYLRLYTSRFYVNKTAVPNSWLTPMTTLPSSTGSGKLALDSGSHLRLYKGGYNYPQAVNSSTPIAFNSVALPALSGASSSVFNKLNTMDNLLVYASSSGFAGAFIAGTGCTTFKDAGILDPMARLVVNPNAMLTVAANQTAASISGSGGLAFGAPVASVRITGDADCGISPDKVYTHAIDFGTSTANAVGSINGVPFLSTDKTSGTCLGTDGVTYGYANMPPTGHAGNSNTSASGNIGKLLTDMNYAHRNESFSLTGLDPAKTYELRIYQRQWSAGTRAQILGYSANDNGVIDHTFAFSSDVEAKAYYHAYRYRPSALGKINVLCVPVLWADSMHLYGLTNEEVPLGIASAPAATLTLSPPSGTGASYDGALTGDGVVIVNGAGTQTFSGGNTTSGGLMVSSGAATLRSGASVSMPVEIQASGALHVTGSVGVGGIAGNGALMLGVPSLGARESSGAYFEFLSDDASTGISAGKSYTHLYDCGNGGAAVINGVAFTKITENTATFNASPALTSHDGSAFSGSALGPVPTSSGLYTLLFDMMHVSAPINVNDGYKETVITLSGLTPGQPYELRVYNRSWSWDNTRHQLVAFCSTLDGVYRDHIGFNPDSLAPNALVYRYIPEGTQLKFLFSGSYPNNGWHVYGLSNEALATAGESENGLNIAVPAGRVDTFGGSLAGFGALRKSGGGALRLTGSSTASGDVVVESGVLGVGFGDASLLTSGTALFAPGSAYLWDWSAAVSGGTLEAGKVVLPESFAIVAGGSEQPPARWPVITSNDAPLTTELEAITLQGFPNSAKAQYSDDCRVLYITNLHGTMLMIR